MTPAPTLNLFAGALGAIVAAMSLVVVGVSYLPVAPQDRAQSARASQDVKIERPPTTDAAALASWRSRPVFAPSRRPPAPPPPPPAAADISDLRLVAVFIKGGTATAIVEPRGAEALRLKKGSTFRGWYVSDVGPRSVAFVAGDLRHRLDLQLPRGSAER